MADVIIEDVGPCRKQLKITVPQAEIQEKLEETYSRLRATAVVAGFRKGHVPRKLLERRFGDEVLEEVKEAILANASQKAVEEHDLKPIGDPSFDNVDFAPEKDCVFEMTLEVEPEFELAECKGIKLQKKAAKVSDEDVEKALERLRMQRARLELLPSDATIRPEDAIICDWELTSDNEVVTSEKDDELVVHGKRFGSLELEKDVSEVLSGARSGEAREVAVKFLDAYPIEKWRGKDGVLTFSPKEIRRPVLPELNEEFAKQMDFDSLADLKEFAKSSIMQGKEREIALDLERQLFDELLERNPFELPEGVHKAQARNIMIRQQFHLQQRGVPQEEIEKHIEALRDTSEAAAARNLKMFFILERIADQEKIFVTENEVANRIAALANSHHMSVQRMRAQLESNGSLSQLRVGMREDKVTEDLLRNAEIEEEKA